MNDCHHIIPLIRWRRRHFAPVYSNRFFYFMFIAGHHLAKEARAMNLVVHSQILQCRLGWCCQRFLFQTHPPGSFLPFGEQVAAAKSKLQLQHFGLLQWSKKYKYSHSDRPANPQMQRSCGNRTKSITLDTNHLLKCILAAADTYPHHPNAATLSKLFHRARTSFGTKSIRMDSCNG